MTEGKRAKIFMHKLVAEAFAKQVGGTVGELIKDEGWPIHVGEMTNTQYASQEMLIDVKTIKELARGVK